LAIGARRPTDRFGLRQDCSAASAMNQGLIVACTQAIRKVLRVWTLGDGQGLTHLLAHAA
jgi:hypothetical protein